MRQPWLAGCTFLPSMMVSAVAAMPLSWQVPVFSGVSLV
jgi:hypothetical protein